MTTMGFRDVYEEAVIDAFVRSLADSGAVVTPASDFFLLGGTSVLGAQLVASLRQTLPVKVTIRDLFRARSAGALADVLRARAAQS
ncbi:Phosphopantetheine attachment site [Parafrankia irregularis]|uniref:Phosphopantetheine attachment site n=2 Tax=Frankiaceae TaxID=74712 RepID=A0A0S4QVL7_9ACTN|nr:acyl carrier protein [Parafrankia sp. CH37]CUU59639.1 Phosphopantetheine attachment site [Parafrankia irregularis]